MSKLVFLLVTLVLGCDSWEFPSFLKKCTCDETLPDCFVDDVNAIRSHLKDGIEAFAIPKLVPYHIDSLVLEITKDLSIKLTDLDVFDLDTYEMSTMAVDFSGQIVSIPLSFDAVHITGTYEVDGKILALPIKGQGPIAVTMEKIKCTYSHDFKLVDRDGVKYFKFSTTGFDFQPGKITMHLDNLFNGDKVLGDQINDLLNENWKELLEMLKGPISETIIGVIDEVVYNIGEAVPAEELCVIPDVNAFSK